VAIGDDEGKADREKGDLGEGKDQVEAVVEAAPEVGSEIEPDRPQHDSDDDRGSVAASQDLAEITGAHRLVAGDRSLGLDALDGEPASLGYRRRRQAAKPRPKPSKGIAADEPGLDKHGEDEDEAEERRHGARR